jgi:hypothetical protein
MTTGLDMRVWTLRMQATWRAGLVQVLAPVARLGSASHPPKRFSLVSFAAFSLLDADAVIITALSLTTFACLFLWSRFNVTEAKICHSLPT